MFVFILSLVNPKFLERVRKAIVKGLKLKE